MKNLKKLMAGLMAISMVATVGVSTGVSAEETQKTFYTGDVNLDGKVNTLDLLSLKKMLLGLADLQEMYIDGDTLKKVEDTQGEDITILANQYTVDVENNIIHVTGIDYTIQVHDLTLKVTDNTTFSGDFSNLEELSKKLDEIPYLCIDITYDSLTKEISQVTQISELPYTLEIIQADNYVVDLEENLIKVQMDTVEETDEPVYLLIKVTDDTVFDSDIVDLEGLSQLEKEENDYDRAISIIYYSNTQEAIDVSRIYSLVEPIPSSTVTSAQDNLIIDIDTENSQVKLTGTGDNANFSDVLNITDDTEITRNGETLTLDELAKITDYQYILISVEYNPHTKEVTKLSLGDINGSEKDIQTISVGQNTDYDIIGVYNTNELRIAIDGGNGVFKVNDDTTYSGGISSLSDIKYPDWYLTISYYVNEDGENIVTNINGFPITVAQ